MRTLYIDCGMGAAGDMLTAALLELLPDPDSFLQEVNALHIPGVAIQKEPAVKCGISGTHMVVTVNGEEEGEHLHDHHHHDHHHHHSSLHQIEHIVEHLHLSQQVKQNVLAVYDTIARAESHVHGVPMDQIHFHEVGTMDAVADIVCVCLLMEKLAPEQVVVSPIHVGSGTVRCAHGILPVPAPATAHILKDVPIYSAQIQSELCTPTGAALLKRFATGFGQMPVMQVEAIGYGMGKKDFPQANCVRALLGETQDAGDCVVSLQCNLDDMTPEAVGFAMEQLLCAGALDVYTTAVGMKKNRPGMMLTVLCKPEEKETMVRLLFMHTTTLGIREQSMVRHTLQRRVDTVQTSYGSVRKKVASGYGVRREKWEYEDIARIAREQNLPLDAVIHTIEE